MDKRANRFLLIGVICLTLIPVTYYGTITRPGIGTWWKHAASPPEPISALRMGDKGEILAQTESGDVYQYIYDSDIPWISINDPTEVIDIGLICNPSDSKRNFIPPAPGRVRSRADVHCVVVESAYHLAVVLLENGKVWTWRYDYRGEMVILVPCFMFFALVNGISSLLAGTVMKIKARKG